MLSDTRGQPKTVVQKGHTNIPNIPNYIVHHVCLTSIPIIVVSTTIFPPSWNPYETRSPFGLDNTLCLSPLFADEYPQVHSVHGYTLTLSFLLVILSLSHANAVVYESFWILVMWEKQCHKPSPSHHHFYRYVTVCIKHSQSWVVYGIVLPILPTLVTK